MTSGKLKSCGKEARDLQTRLQQAAKGNAEKQKDNEKLLEKVKMVYQYYSLVLKFSNLIML